MNTDKPGRLDGMSGAGLLVVGTMCLALVGVVGTACALSVMHPGVDLPPALDRLLAGLMLGVPALLAKTYRDSKDTGAADPTTVTAPADSSVRIDPPPDAGHADLGLLHVMLAVALIAAALYDLNGAHL